MPLTELQGVVAQLLAQNRTPDSHLAGGAALHIEPNSARYSNDLDYFQDSQERVAEAYTEDRATLEAAGFAVLVQMAQPGYVRAEVAKDEASTKIEWAHDSAWRFLPPIKSALAGYMLHPVDLAVNKLLALVGRDEARDFLDIIELHKSVLTLGALAWAAAGKDPGHTPHSILELLRRRGRYQSADFERLRLRVPVDLRELKRRWLDALSEAEVFVRSRPAEEIGCLYYSAPQARFVSGPLDVLNAMPHFGRPGGVLPRLWS